MKYYSLNVKYLHCQIQKYLTNYWSLKNLDALLVKHKILLVGSTGMLGSEIYNKFKDIFTLLPTACNNPNKNTLKLDLTNFNNV